MLYLIGGACRAGKTTIAERMLQQNRIPRFTLEYFVSALDRGCPELDVKHSFPNLILAQKLWPRLEPMLRNIVEVEPHYTVEGDALLPCDVACFLQGYPGKVRACFIGYPTADKNQKLEQIRKHADGINNWVVTETDATLLSLIDEMVEFSRYLETECRKEDLPFFNISGRFTEPTEKAYQYLANHVKLVS